MSLVDRAIPVLTTPNWSEIYTGKIVESQDKLVKVDRKGKIFCQSFYYESKIEGSLPDIWLRESVAEKLQIVVASLPESMGVIILDGWRPYAVQKALRDSVGDVIHTQEPNLSQAEFEARLSEFVAEPRTQKDSPSPHLTGGSVDLTLCDLSGNALDMGTEFDSPEEDSWTASFEKAGKSVEIRDRRRILFNAMKDAGFTNLPTEWWHFDYGNQSWAHYSQSNYAIYTAASL